MSDRYDYRALHLDPARAPRVAVLVADALTKLRAARLAEADALSALLTVFVDIGAGSEGGDPASGTAPEAGCSAAHSPIAAEPQYLSVRQLADLTGRAAPRRRAEAAAGERLVQMLEQRVGVGGRGAVRSRPAPERRYSGPAGRLARGGPDAIGTIPSRRPDLVCRF